jgi:protein O-GlcNAc transferase
LIGRVEGALRHFKKCLAIQPDNTLVWDLYLFALVFSEATNRKLIFQENRRWGRILESKISLPNKLFSKPSGSAKKIKIGYYSKYFYSHVTVFFFETLLMHHDYNSFEIYCYSDVAETDAVTERLKEKSNFWHNVYQMDYLTMSQKIRSDNIDIFVGLSNFMPSNRIISAYRPAPIVVSYMNQASTTGLKNVDYMIVDERISPNNVSANLFTEKLIRISNFACYYPPVQAVKITPPPVIKNGYITFGSFHNVAKVNRTVIATWSKILDTVENSCIRLHAPKFEDETVKENFINLFNDYGITPNRIKFYGMVAERENYLRQYNLIDIALDTFPLSGGTVTDETLYMSVPIITLVGDREYGSMGYSKLSRLGLNNLIAKTLDDYIFAAVNLAMDLNKIIYLKSIIRERALKTIFNGEEHVSELEEAYQQMWKNYYSDIN